MLMRLIMVIIHNIHKYRIAVHLKLMLYVIYSSIK